MALLMVPSDSAISAKKLRMSDSGRLLKIRCCLTTDEVTLEELGEGKALLVGRLNRFGRGLVSLLEVFHIVRLVFGGLI